MQNLFFKLQHDHQFKRHAELLRYLSLISYKISIPKLAKVLGCYPQTVREDIVSLNIMLSESIKISNQTSGKVSLIYNQTVSIDSLVATLAKETLVYQIIDSILHGEDWSLEQATDHLSVPKEELIETIQYMNQTLKSFSISISVELFSFIGKEADIRTFLFAFYSEFGDRTIILDNSSTYVDEFLQLYEKSGLEKIHFCHFRLAIWISISNIRRSNQHFTFLPEGLMNEVIDRNSFKRYCTISQALYQAQNTTDCLPTDELVWSYVVALDCVAYTDIHSPSRSNFNFVYRWEEEENIIRESWRLLSNTFPQRSPAFTDTKTLDITEAFLINMRLLTQISNNFEITTYGLKGMVVDTYNELYEIWCKQLRTFVKYSHFKFSKIDEVAINLTLFHASYIRQQQRKKKLHVLFAFQGSGGFDDYLAKFSQSLVTDNIEAEYFLERVMDEQIIKEKNTELVICNYDLHLQGSTDCKIVRMSNIPTPVDWGIARNAIEKLLHQ